MNENKLTVLSLTIKGCTRFRMSGITRIDMTMENPLQVFIGTNGAGKSTLMNECHMMPSDPNYYEREGFREITSRFNDVIYTIKSDFSKSTAHHSFIRDGEELCPGGTITVCRDLCYSHFGIDLSIVEMMSDRFDFTALGLTKRREVFSRLDTDGCGYALQVFKRVDKQARQHEGYIKIQKDHLANEILKVDALKKEEASLVARAKSVNDFLSKVVHELHGTDGAYVPVAASLERLKLEREEVYRTYMKLPQVSVKWDNGMDGINQKIEELKRTRAGMQGKVEEAGKRHDDYHEKFTLIQGVGNADPKDQRMTIAEKQRFLDDNPLSTDGIPLMMSYDERQVSSIDVYVTQLNQHLSQLSPDPDRKYTPAARNALESTISSLKYESSDIANKCQNLTHRLEHYLSTDEEQCPKCNHTWRADMSLDVAMERDTIAKYEQEKSNVLAKIATINETLSELDEYSNYLNDLSMFFSNHQEHHVVKDYLMEHRLIATVPKDQLGLLVEYSRNVKLSHQRRQAEQDMSHAQAMLDRIESLDSLSNIDYRGELDKIEADIYDLEFAIKQVSSEINHLEFCRKRMHQFAELMAKFTSLDKAVDDKIQELKNTCEDSLLLEAISKHQIELGEINKSINTLHTSAEIILNIERTLKDAEFKLSCLNDIRNALCPKSGIIAVRMRVFVNAVVESVNEIIRHIYNYPMEVLSCGMDGDSLDYKFPVMLEDGLLEVEDVSKLSAGQKEIVCFAFGLVIQSYLGFGSYPIHLDEVGRAQDPAHLSNLMKYVKELVESGKCSQLFMVSHMATGYGILNNADVTVLNELNVAIPDNANKNVIIDKSMG